MSEETVRQPYSRAKLQDTDEMAERFYAFGKEGIPNWAIAARLGVHANTVGTFLRRAPKSGAALEKGRAEAEEEMREREGPFHAARRGPGAAKPGVCPACGRPAEKDAIMLTPAMIAEAQKTLDAIIDRHLAARGAVGDETGSG